MITTLDIRTRGQGLHEITAQVQGTLVDAPDEGLCTVFVQHTSASLVIQENADPSARADLDAWMGRLVREDDPHFTHTAEGPDDMPGHIRAALTPTSVAIPFAAGRLLLGTWQGLYLWEHRRRGATRRLLVHLR